MGTDRVARACTGMQARGAERVQPGEQDGTESFEDFYASHVDRVYRALAVALADFDLAREATDEAMLRAYARWSRVGSYDNPGGWVFRVGLNWATSWWRRARGERTLLGNAAWVDPPDATVAVTALAALPVSQRAVVVCRVLLELSTSETAAVLGVPEGTVKSRLARALAGLRAALTEEEQ